MSDQIVKVYHLIDAFTQVVVDKQTRLSINRVRIDRLTRIAVNTLRFRVQTVANMNIEKVVLKVLNRPIIITIGCLIL